MMREKIILHHSLQDLYEYLGISIEQDVGFTILRLSGPSNRTWINGQRIEVSGGRNL